MKKNTFSSSLLLCLSVLSIGALSVYGQQSGDSTYNPPVPNPAWTETEGPRVHIDEAHNNFHTANGRYAPFARLLRKDGFRLGTFADSFSIKSLSSANILVIANALHEQNMREWINPTLSAFTPDEVTAVKDWVKSGGSLLLIADHMPFPGAAQSLAEAFGFTLNNGFAFDTSNTTQSRLVFKRNDGSLSTGPLTNEGMFTYRIDSVTTFTGQGFQIPQGARSLLNLSESVISLMPDTAWQFNANTPRKSLKGHSQGAVLEFGAGRVAVFGEAAMFTAQVSGTQQLKMGMNATGAEQNHLFILNLMRWLAGKY